LTLILLKTGPQRSHRTRPRRPLMHRTIEKVVYSPKIRVRLGNQSSQRIARRNSSRNIVSREA
jgi:hypothetical protein